MLTESQFIEFYKRGEAGDIDYLKTRLSETIIFRFPGRPIIQGLDAVIDHIQRQEEIFSRTAQVNSVVTDGKTAVAALVSSEAVFKVDLAEFMGMTDVKRGDKIVAQMATFVKKIILWGLILV
jgi:hypothetical protein